MKIYTKTGDGGYSDILGKRVKKSDKIFALVGTVDKLNAVLSLGVNFCTDDKVKSEILALQSEIVKLNGKISGYGEFDFDVLQFEERIDFYSEKTVGFSLYNMPQKKDSAFFNLARTICRDAERTAVEIDSENTGLIRYLNRMSDYLYAVGKYLDI
mgnify:FL=1